MDLGQLQLVALSAGLPLDWRNRVSRVQQPAASAAAVSEFNAKLIALTRPLLTAVSAPNPPMSYILNPSGQAWLLLAFPDENEEDALQIFGEDTVDQQAGDAVVFRTPLAGPEYEGVAVLARGLLGPAPVLASGGALAFETIFWEEPCAAVDPRKWSVGCFKSSDPLLPVFLVRISAALHSDRQDEVMRLGRQNSYLRSKGKIRNGIDDWAKEAERSKQRRANHKEETYVAGHKRVKVAESQQPETSLRSIDFKSEIEDDIQPMAAAIGSSMVRWTRGAGTPGEVEEARRWSRACRRREQGRSLWSRARRERGGHPAEPPPPSPPDRPGWRRLRRPRQRGRGSRSAPDRLWSCRRLTRPPPSRHLVQVHPILLQSQIGVRVPHRRRRQEPSRRLHGVRTIPTAHAFGVPPYQASLR